jgi:hypothetical protein
MSIHPLNRKNKAIFEFGAGYVFYKCYFNQLVFSRFIDEITSKIFLNIIKYSENMALLKILFPLAQNVL